FACLDALVAGRRARGLPAPVADSARDREEFTRSVRAFLERLREAIAVGLTPEQREKVDAAADATGDPTRRLLAVQVALAKALPDYWQRVEASRASYLGAEPASGGQRRRRLRPPLGRARVPPHDDHSARRGQRHLRREARADVLLRLSRARAPRLPERARPDRRGPGCGGHADARRERPADVARPPAGRAVRRAPGADRAR